MGSESKGNGMDQKTIESKKQDPQEKNLKMLQFLLDNDLAKNPVIGRLMNTAVANGDFCELEHYISINHSRFETFSRMALLEAHRQQKNPYYPYPLSGDDLKALTGPIKFGMINPQQNIWFGMNTSDMTMHQMTGGRTGTGKSWGAAFVVGQLLQHNDNFNVVIPDTKTFYRRLLPIVHGLHVIPLEKLRWNPLAIPDWMDPRYFILQFSKVFSSENLLGLPSEGILTESLHRLFNERGIFEGSHNYCNLQDLLEMVIRLQADKILGQRYRDIFGAVINRLKPYVYLEDIFCVRKGISHEVFATENVILELPLDKISNNIHNFIACWILNLNFARNIAMGLRGTELRTLYIIDEASTILNASREHSGLDWIEPSINTIIAKGREFGLGLWLLSQQTDSFSNIFRANCILKMCFSLTDGDDVTNIQKSFGLNEEQTQFLFQLPKNRAAICRYGDFPRPFLCVFPELKNIDKVPTDSEVNAAMADFYTRIIPKEDSAINLKKEKPDQYPLTPATVDGLIIIKHLLQNPFLNYRELIQEMHLTPAKGDMARTWLANSGYVCIHSIALRGKPGEYFELTEKAYQHFKGKPPAGKGSFEHKAFCHAIKDYVEKNGFDARLEGVMEDTEKAIDVLAWKKGVGMIGYEVTLHFENLISNLVQDLRTTLKTVVVACRNKDELRKAIAIVRESSIPTDRLEFKTIFEFTQKQEG
jgi:hypothetical protein